MNESCLKHIYNSFLFKNTFFLSPLFIWLKLFYQKHKGFHFLYLLYYFFPQKILRINGSIPWPAHFTSRILNYKNISVGNRTAPGINSGCYIQGREGIILGHNCRIGPNVGLISANHDPDNFDRWLKSTPINIGDNVWIGMGTIVMPGVSIGDNVIIGANSVVNKNIPSNSIAAGIPCKVIKKKNSYNGINYNIL